jgi:TPR repeat protein
MAEAVKWFRKAAEQGKVEAQAILSDCYAKGLGVEQDKAEAFKWRKKAEEQGFGVYRPQNAPAKKAKSPQKKKPGQRKR